MHNLKYSLFSNFKLLIALMIISFCNTVFATNYSIYETLDSYGFSDKTQKEALTNLMRSAGILSNDQNINDLYPPRSNQAELLEDILSFVQHLQKHFVLRSGNQERWEIQASAWMHENKETIIANARKLGLTEKIMSKQKQTDAICILGSTLGSMQKRINYVAESVNSKVLVAKNLILLAGERKVSTKVDGDEQSLLQIAKKYNIDDLNELTETHLIQFAYDNSSLHNKLQTFVIDTPAGDLPRPTTETTLKELIKWLENHKEIKKITFVSNQPYIKYQEAIIAQVIANLNPNIAFEVIGPEASKDIEVFRILEGLGSYIWAKTPSVISHFEKFKADEELLQAFKKLYGKNPLMYSDIENLFESK